MDQSKPVLISLAPLNTCHYKRLYLCTLNTLEKYWKLFAAFMNLDNAYDKVDWKGLWDIQKIYGMGGSHRKASCINKESSAFE